MREHTGNRGVKPAVLSILFIGVNPMKPYGIIYKITNKTNGKCYIGQTIQKLKYRWKSHCKKSSNKPQYAINYAIKKYGPGNFIIEQICECNNQFELDNKEIEYIKFYNSIIDNKKGYNLTSGGQSRGKASKETKIKLSLSHIGKSTKLQFTKDVCKKISIALKGNKNSLGFKQSDETIRKRVETRKRNGSYKQTPESNAKRVETRKRNGNYGRSKESIQKGIETKKRNGTYGNNQFTNGNYIYKEESKIKSYETKKRNGTLGNNKFTRKNK